MLQHQRRQYKFDLLSLFLANKSHGMYSFRFNYYRGMGSGLSTAFIVAFSSKLIIYLYLKKKTNEDICNL